MSGAATKPGLEQEVREWAEQHQEEAPPPAPEQAPPPQTAAATPESTTAAPSSPRPDDDDEDDDDQAITPEEAAAMFVGLIDFGLTVFVSPKLEFRERQERKLVKLAVPLAKKYLPDTAGVASPEMAFAFGLGMICFKNYTSSPEPGRAPASPPGGSVNANGSSGGPTTEANVDGRAVHAEVLQ